MLMDMYSVTDGYSGTIKLGSKTINLGGNSLLSTFFPFPPFPSSLLSCQIQLSDPRSAMWRSSLTTKHYSLFSLSFPIPSLPPSSFPSSPFTFSLFPCSFPVAQMP